MVNYNENSIQISYRNNEERSKYLARKFDKLVFFLSNQIYEKNGLCNYIVPMPNINDKKKNKWRRKNWAVKHDITNCKYNYTKDKCTQNKKLAINFYSVDQIPYPVLDKLVNKGFNVVGKFITSNNTIYVYNNKNVTKIKILNLNNLI